MVAAVEEGGHFAQNTKLGKRPDSTFTFSDCRYVIKKKEILKGLSGTVKSGEVLAIVGPSGAGKTMLMNTFTLTPGPGKRTGRVTLNGEELTLSKFKKYFSYVPQSDNHSAFLTTREALEFAADVQHTYNAEEKASLVDTLLQEMGLMSCQHTRIGNQFVQGLSGGQKRRLSLAIALVKKPSVLILDEPTSGLDAAAAQSIMGFFKEIAINLNIIIVASIHQPSTKVYNGFDTTMVITEGRAAYYGPASFLPDYLEGIDRAIPKNSNPAEHVLDLVNSEFVDKEEVDYMVDKWAAFVAEQSENADSYMYGMSREVARAEKAALPPCEDRPGLLHQMACLLKRHGTLMYRDPILYVGRALAFLFACAFFSLVYIEAAKRTQGQAPYKMFLFMWHIGVPSALGVVAVFAYNLEHVSIKREVKQGMYHPIAYCLSSFLLQLPMMFILAIMSLTVGGYSISNYHWPMYGQMVLLYACTLWSFESLAQLWAVQFPNPLLGMLQYMNLWFASFLFCGVMVPEEDVPWPLKIFCFITPLKYFLKSAMQTDLHDTTFSGAVLDAGDSRGFSCPGEGSSNSLQCYGFTGNQVLDSVGLTFKSISSKDTYARDVLIILATGIVFKLVCTALIVKDCSSYMSCSDAKEGDRKDEGKNKTVSPA